MRNGLTLSGFFFALLLVLPTNLISMGNEGDFVFRCNLEGVSFDESGGVALQIKVSGIAAEVFLTERARIRTGSGQVLTLDELAIGSTLEVTADWGEKGFVATAVTVPETDQVGAVGLVDRILPWQLVVSGIEFSLDESSLPLTDRLATGQMVAVMGTSSLSGGLSATQIISQEQFWIFGKISAKNESGRTLTIASRTVVVPEKARIIASDKTSLDFMRLATGMTVSVTGSTTGGTLTAEEIRIVETSGRVEIRGQFVSAGAGSISLKSLDTVFTIKTDAKTEITGTLSQGAIINVSAILQPDGSLLALRIVATKTIDGNKGNEAGLSGIIEKTDPAVGTILIQGVTVVTSNQTVIISGGKNIRIADLKVGDKVKVTGTKQADGRFLAARIEVLTTPAPTSEITFDGTIEKISTDGKTILVRGVTVLINDQTKIVFLTSTAASQSLKIGDKVKIAGRKQENGSVLASRIDVLPAIVETTEVVFDGTIEKILPERSIIVVKGINVLISPETIIQAGGKQVKLSDLKPGDLVKIKGLKKSDGTVRAVLIVVVPK